MNDFQSKIFNDLEALVASTEVFYRQEFALDGVRYWIYNYRLASYTDFTKPSALECRGIMFEVDANDAPVRLVSLPMPKFFNLYENPFTMNVDLSTVDTVELKADGSLMSTYMHNGQLRLKSRGSLFSEQAIDAMKWLQSVPEFYDDLKTITEYGWTVNMEWCAPHNRIVIGYDKPHLVVLNARCMRTGAFQSRAIMEYEFKHRMIKRVDTKGLDVAAFVQSIPDMTDDIEGYVCRVGDLWFKSKTSKYMSLHHTKDSITNPRRLFEAVVDEGVDDLRAMFHTDETAIKLIDGMVARVDMIYNHMVAVVDNFYANNKHLDRKEFAIKGQQELESRLYFGLVMQLYVGKTIDYKSVMKAHYKDFGIRDAIKQEE